MAHPVPLFDLALPIVQAPMAGVSTPALAAAVSEAGGLGSLGLGASPPAEARRMIEEVRARTDRPFNVNVFCHAPPRRDPAREAAWLGHLAPLFAEFDATPPATLAEIYPSFLADETVLRLLLELKPPVVSFHFGLPPADWIAGLRAAGVRTMATATSQAEAARIERSGIDAIVAQGIEAGGHRGVFDPEAPDERLPMAALARLILRDTRLPVAAAGGIMNGRDLRAALDLGAAAGQLGTAFILCPESAASPAYRARLRGDAAKSTRLTTVLSGRPARGMVNRLIRHGEAADAPAPADYPLAYDAAKRLAAAAGPEGDVAAFWAGQGAPLAREMPAARLVETLIAEMR